MKTKILLSLIGLCGGGIFALLAQSRPITGIVSDQKGPVAGATVLVEGTSQGTTTGYDGKFSLSAPANSTLIISFLGYETQKVAVAGKTHIPVTLKEDSQNIDIVTVIGYGSGSKVGTTIGSVSKIKGEVLENKPTPNIADALQGKVAGLAVYTDSGEPSASNSIRLHGAGSISAGTAPLIVLDGVPVSMSIFNSLNSNDIESINTLKDASATSIYGSRAANGVIYIVTKRGRRNEDISIVARAQYGISQPATNKYDVMSGSELAAYQLEYEHINQSRYDEIMASGVNTNWRDYYYRSNAPVYQFDLSLTGGSEKTAYYVSGSYMSKDGTAPGSSLERYSFRSDVNVNAKDWLKFGASVNMSFDSRALAYTEINSVYNAAFMSLLSPPYESPYDDNGKERETIAGYPNPNYMRKTHPSGGKNLTVNGNAFIQITPVKNLNIKSVFGTDAYAYWSDAYALASYIGGLNNGNVSRAHQNGGTFTITNTVDYNFEFANPDHKFYLLAGQEGIRSDNLSFSAQRAGQIRDELMMLSAGVGMPSVGDSKSGYAFNSWFARAEYGYADKYIFDASVRRDASSRFSPDNRSGIFYAFGAMWDLKQEKFLRDSKAVSALKFKLSYGTQGNAEITDYAHLSHLSTTAYGDLIGLYNASEGDPSLGWETQKLFTVAVNVGLYDRIRLEAEFYNRVSDNLLMDVPIPATTGYTTRPKNVGAMVNRGIDLTFSADILRTKDWYVGFNATFNYNRNKMTRLFDGRTEYALSGAGICYTIGHDWTEFYLQKYMGVNSDNGAPQWEIIDPQTGERGLTEDYNKATQQLLGKSYLAPYTGGFGVNAIWKGISVSADFSWNYGKYLINNGLTFLENPGLGMFNRSRRLLRAWKEPGDDTDVPRQDLNYETKFDTSILEDASFLRLKNLTISYDFPKKLIQRSGFLSGLKIYFVSRNLLTFTKYTGYDPEVDTNISLGDYPNTREFMGGIQLTF